jgi:hypothetical protein
MPGPAVEQIEMKSYDAAGFSRAMELLKLGQNGKVSDRTIALEFDEDRPSGSA